MPKSDQSKAAVPGFKPTFRPTPNWMLADKEFSWWSKAALRRAVIEMRERLKEVERQRKEELAKARESARIVANESYRLMSAYKRSQAALADRDRQVRELVRDFEALAAIIEERGDGERGAGRAVAYRAMCYRLRRLLTQPEADPEVPREPKVSLRELRGLLRLARGKGPAAKVEAIESAIQILDEHLDCQPTPELLGEEGGFEHCKRCGRGNTLWFAPSPLWNAVMRGGSIEGDPIYGDLVCATCFMTLAEERGIADGFKVYATRVHVELETVTPSGRVWDEERELWVDPGKQPPAEPQEALIDAVMAKFVPGEAWWDMGGGHWQGVNWREVVGMILHYGGAFDCPAEPQGDAVEKAAEQLARKRLACRGDWWLLPAGECNRALVKARRDVEEVADYLTPLLALEVKERLAAKLGDPNEGFSEDALDDVLRCFDEAVTFAPSEPEERK